MLGAFTEHFGAAFRTAFILATHALTMQNLMFAFGANALPAFTHVMATMFSHVHTTFLNRF